MTTPTSSRVRIAKPDGAGSRDIFVDGVKIGRCVKLQGLGFETSWRVRGADVVDRYRHFHTIADIRSYFDPTPVT